MKLIEKNYDNIYIAGLLDTHNKPFLFKIQRVNALNYGEITTGKITHKNTTLGGYFIETEKSRSYVFNSKTKREYLFEGAISDLWNFLLNNSSYEKLEKYAITKKLNEQLDEHVYYLKKKKLQHLFLLLQNRYIYPYIFHYNQLLKVFCNKLQ